MRQAGLQPGQINAEEDKMLTTVTNLATGAEKTYSLAPKDAVRAAYLQERKDWNTWDYAKRDVTFVQGKRTIAAGDWCAILKQRGPVGG